MLQPGRFVACIFAVQKAAHNALSVSWPTCLPAVHAGAAVQSGAHDTAETAAGCRLSFHFCLQERHSKTTCRRLYQSTCLPAVPTGAAACSLSSIACLPARLQAEEAVQRAAHARQLADAAEGTAQQALQVADRIPDPRSALEDVRLVARRVQFAADRARDAADRVDQVGDFICTG